MAIPSLNYPMKFILKMVAAVCMILIVTSCDQTTSSNTADHWVKAGENYIYGENGKTINYEIAFNYFQKAADKNNSTAQYYVGVMFRDGIGCQGNSEEAVKWFKKAATQGFPEAQYNLGVMYRDGFGDTKDPVEAVEWFKKAANHGIVEAQYNLGVMYRDGFNKTINYHEAIEWFRKAANQGDVDAQINLGKMLLEYFPLSKYEEAFTSFTKAAEQGNIGAQHYVGYLNYLDGNYEEAMEWFLKTAKKGYAKSQSQIGFMYLHGQGVEQCYLQAYKWFIIASYENELVRLVERHLPKADIEKAKRMAKIWKQQNIESTDTP